MGDALSAHMRRVLQEHPAQFSSQVLEAIRPHLALLRLPVHDPFAGPGVRLAAVCDDLGLDFTGTEIEREFIVDFRVSCGNSTHKGTYPDWDGDYVVVTSPVYPNGMTDHHHAKDDSTRHTYRSRLAKIIGEDRELDPHNMGRYGNRVRRSAASERTYYWLAEAAVQHWPANVIVNVKDCISGEYLVTVVTRWRQLLERFGYVIVDDIQVPVSGNRHGENHERRVDHEHVLVCHRPG